AAQFFLVEQRFRQDVRQHIDGERHMILEDPRIIRGGLRGGGGIQFAADILDFLGDVAGAAPCRALEGHVLEEMGDAVLVLGFVARAGLDPHAEGDALQMWHGFGRDRQPGSKPGHLYIHRLSFWRGRHYFPARAWSSMNFSTALISAGRMSKRSSRFLRSASHDGSAGSIPQADFTAAGNFAGWAVASVTIGLVAFACFLAAKTPVAVCGSRR